MPDRKYYVSVDHEQKTYIHNEDCDYLQNCSQKEYIGTFSHVNTALSRAAEIYPDAVICNSCSKTRKKLKD